MAGSIEKRGKDTFRLKVSAGFGQNGKRIIHRRTIKTNSKRQAEKELAKFVAEVKAGKVLESSKKTFKQFAEYWIEKYAEGNLKKSTLYGYKQMLNNRINPAIGHVKIEKIKQVHLVQFYYNLQENGIRKDGKTGGLSAQTIKHHHNCISSILQSAVEWEIIPQNVANKVKPPKVTQKEADFYTEAEVTEILKALSNEPLKYNALFTLAFMTGLRKGELLGLEWSNIDFDNKMIHVRQTSLYRPGKEYGVYTDTPKSNSSKRSISISNLDLELLNRLKIEQENQKEKLMDLWEDHNRLFTQWNGKPMHPSTVNNQLKKFLKKNGLPIKSFHTARHTNITLLLANNVDLKTVIQRAGHSDGLMTINKYAHALKTKDREAANKLEKYFSEL